MFSLKWQRIARTNPRRVVSLLTAETPNRWGDDAFKELDTVIDALFYLMDKWESDVWEGLINEGIVKVICDSTLLHVKIFSEEEKRAGLEAESHASWFTGISLLRTTALYAKSGHLVGPAQQRFVVEIKENWSKMMSVLWLNPGNSLKAESHHVDERYCTGAFLLCMLLLDPSILAVLDSPKDFTVPVLTRMWLHSTESKDFSACSTAISASFWPHTQPMAGSECGLVEYREIHPTPQHIIISFTRGFPGGSPRRFIQELERRMPTLDAQGLYDVSVILANLCRESQWGRSDADDAFIRAICRSQELFDGLFLALREPDKVASSETCENNAVTVPITMLVYTIIRKLVEGWRGHRDSFIRICRKGRLFDGIESITSQGVPCKPFALGTIICILKDLCTLLLACPELIPILRHDLPRPRIMHACLRLGHDPEVSQFYSAHQAQVDLSQELSVAWSFVDRLQSICHVDGTCMRRGCRRKRTKSCKACRSTQYCGLLCQKQDWAEHRLVCGHHFSRSEDDPASGDIVLPFRFPMRQ